jgi:RNA polymerase sigma-70 factor, ECF subfamily
MLRATRIEIGGGLEALRVEGRLTHETAEELRLACEATLASQGSLELDVAGLRFVDPAGVDVLRGLEERGAHLAGGSLFVRELLRDETQRPEPPEGVGAAGDGPTRPDAALVAGLRANDPQALETVIREYGGRMLATARRFVGSDEDAKDVTQSAFLAALRALDGFTGSAQLSTWLHRIVVNAALMKLRSRRRRPEGSIEDLLPRFAEDGHWAEPQSHWETSVDAQIDRRRTRAVVRAAIERLPAAYRSVLLLRDIEERDTDETAALLGLKPNAVRTRLHRARQALRTLLQQEFPPDRESLRFPRA